MFSFDPALSLSVNALVVAHPCIATVMVFCAEYTEYFVYAGIVLAFLVLVRTSLRHACILVCMVGIAGVVRFGLKPLLVFFMPVARPYVALHDIVLLASPQTGEEMQSFPSGHALFFFALATAMYMHNKKAGVLLYTLAVCMALGRVATGLHYTSDVVIGACIGVIAAYGIVRALHAFAPRHILNYIHIQHTP